MDMIGAREELEQYLLGWIRSKVGEGLGILKKERAFGQIAEGMKYVEGDQMPMRSGALSRITDNRIRKIVLETVSALTDVRPIWNYETYVEEYKPQSEIQNKLARGWWKNSQADRRLQSTLTYACVGGSGYAALTWNPDLPGGGDLELVPYDTRDVIPIEPVFTDTIQDWRGVILRKRLPVATVRAMFPTKAHMLTGKAGSWFGQVDRDSSGIFNVASTAWSILSAGAGKQEISAQTSTDLLNVYVKDESIHTGDQPILMGDPDSNWCYTVYPVGSTHPETGQVVTEKEARLYPRGRLIVCTPEAILKDCPNPYWHGMFPLVRFTLDPEPWSLLGAAMVGDLIPLQNALNEALRGLEDGMGQWVRRGIIADKTAVPKSTLDAIDTRRAGMKASVNPVAGDGFKVIDGPMFPPWYMEMVQYFKEEMDEISGVRGLQQLAQLKQMPAAETMEKYMDALSPLLRIRARSIEVSLGELAELLKVGFFQFYDVERRMQILGKDGISMEDFDYDPGSLVPAGPGPRHERAEKHHRNFSFSVAPNSFLNVSHSTQKMFILQLLRSNLMDPWSAWETFDLANTGHAPAETVPERIIAARKMGLLPGPTPEMVQIQEQMAQMQLLAMQMQMQQGMGAMALMGGHGGTGEKPPIPGGGGAPVSGTTSQGGRPPSGGQPPQFVQRDGGTRTVVSESGS